MRTQYQLGRKGFVMDQIIMDSKVSVQDELRELKESPENLINCIYDISYDEMTKTEIYESVRWIEKQLKSQMPS